MDTTSAFVGILVDLRVRTDTPFPLTTTNIYHTVESVVIEGIAPPKGGDIPHYWYNDKEGNPGCVPAYSVVRIDEVTSDDVIIRRNRHKGRFWIFELTK